MSDLYGKVKLTNKGQKMKNSELAELIRNRFSPFAFTCDCNGMHIECATAREDVASWVQYETTNRIAKFIESIEEN